MDDAIQTVFTLHNLNILQEIKTTGRSAEKVEVVTAVMTLRSANKQNHYELSLKKWTKETDTA